MEFGKGKHRYHLSFNPLHDTLEAVLSKANTGILLKMIGSIGRNKGMIIIALIGEPPLASQTSDGTAAGIFTGDAGAKAAAVVAEQMVRCFERFA